MAIAPKDDVMTAMKPENWDRLVRLARSNLLIPILLVLEIIETTIIPFPYEALFVALCLAAPKRVWLFIAITVAGSAVAAAIVYAMGAGLVEPLSQRFGIEDAIESYRYDFQDNGAFLIFLGGLTPIPAYLTNLAAGASGYPFLAFLALFSFSRFVRFAAIALLVHFYGDRILTVWKRLPYWAKLLSIIALILIVLFWSVYAFL